MASFAASVVRPAPVAVVQERKPGPARARLVAARATKNTSTYVAPSSRTAASELEALERFSEVVPDVLLSQTLQDVEEPKAATASRSVLAGIMSTPTSRFKFAVEQARFYDKAAQLSGSDRVGCLVDKALVNVGAMFLENVKGRVSTEVDSRLAYDAEGIAQRGRQLIQMYAEVGVPKDRVVLRIPATWQGIQAAKALEADGIACHLVLVYSFVQGAAAAQNNVSVVQPNVGRLVDWHNRHPNVMRDPRGPAESAAMSRAGYGVLANPGLLLVERIYNYCKKYYPKTLVMASGLRTKEEALSLAGCDFLVVGPKVLKSLYETGTLEGYNDGLSAASGMQGMQAVLTPDRAQSAEFYPDDLLTVDEKHFKETLGMAATELLDEGVKRLVQDADRLEPIFLNLAGGQT